MGKIIKGPYQKLNSTFCGKANSLINPLLISAQLKFVLKDYS